MKISYLSICNWYMNEILLMFFVHTPGINKMIEPQGLLNNRNSIYINDFYTDQFSDRFSDDCTLCHVKTFSFFAILVISQNVE